MDYQTYNIIAIVLSVLNAICLSFMAYKFVHTYQLNNYHMTRLVNWFRRTNGKYWSRLFLVSVLSLAGLLVANVLFASHGKGVLSYIGLAFYFSMVIWFVVGEASVPKKKPIVFTNRIRRLYVTLFVVVALATYGLMMAVYGASMIGGGELGSLEAHLRFVIVGLSPIILPLYVLVAIFINFPFEEIRRKMYISTATKKLQKYTNLIKIGITGSYAKTSVKNILKAMLSVRYKVLASKGSYNTPLGNVMTISKLKPSHDVLIAEMGARNVGQIKELCDMVRPNIGIITGITGQHLETFGTIDNIIKCKRELFDSLDDSGVAFVNGDSEYADRLIDDRVETVVSGGDDGVVRAKNVTIDKNGSQFDLVIGDDVRRVRTSMLGKHNVSNIVLASAVAHRLGITIDEIALVIPTLKATEHRLELRHNTNGITVIDDTFNANITGSRASLEVLGYFDSRRIIVTPGLVELGDREEVENYNLGVEISKVCDLVVLIGTIRTQPIYRGLEDAGYDMDNVLVYDTLNEAKQDFSAIFRVGDTVLLENDLPDDYSEVEMPKKKGKRTSK
ncbi:MAG: UDP-N-acetylmuramoyl-tripeptide--D-alanyl-D-alanine ligase [Clostridia bacterium]|nr:UDP-N-acetylmuramoyl-tripeptide--D-alanyl-D-alanine ligase [Clostridia bacterium]